MIVWRNAGTHILLSHTYQERAEVGHHAFQFRKFHQAFRAAARYIGCGMRRATLYDYKRRMQKVLGHIQLHLDDPLPLDELAGVASFSPYHFHRVFRGMVGEPVKEYVRRLRLERAAMRLHAGAAVTEVAFEAGYESHEAFTRATAADNQLAVGHPLSNRLVHAALSRPEKESFHECAYCESETDASRFSPSCWSV